MATLNLIFNGLVSFVPRGPKGKEYMTVLLPNCPHPHDSPGHPHGGKRASVLGGHFALLRVKEQYLHTDTNRKRHWYLRNLNSMTEEYLIFLRNERLTVSSGNSSPESFRVADAYGDLDHPNIDEKNEDIYQAQRREFQWVPRMSEANSRSGEVDPLCLQESATKQVAVQVELREGELGTHKLAGELDQTGKPRRFDLYHFPGKRERALAEEVSLKLDCADKIAIESRRFSGGEPYGSVILKSINGFIECQIQALELEGVLLPPQPSERLEHPEDFVLFYELAYERPPYDERDYPLRGSRKGGGTGGPRICPTSRFEQPADEQ